MRKLTVINMTDSAIITASHVSMWNIVPVEEIEDFALATDYQVENLAWSSLRQQGGTNYITFDVSNGGLDPSRVQAACQRLVSYSGLQKGTKLWSPEGVTTRCPLKTEDGAVFYLSDIPSLALSFTHVVIQRHRLSPWSFDHPC